MAVLAQIVDGYPFQLVLAAHLFACYFPKRSHFLLRVSAHTFPMLVIYNIGVRLIPAIDNFMLDRMLLIIPVLYTMAGIRFCYQCTMLDAVYCTSSAYPAQNIVYNLYWILKLRQGFQEGSPQGAFISLLFIAAVYLLVWFFFARRMKDWEEREYIRTKLVANAAVVVIFLVFLNQRVPESNTEQIVYISYIIGDILALGMQSGLLTESAMDRRNAIMEQLLYAEQKKQRMALENIELINRKCHDLKYQLQGLKQMESGVERDRYIGQIERAVMIYESTIKTGNETLDIILMDKLLYCKQHHISMTCIADGTKLECLDTMDIYSLFGNALDNAIESVIQEPEESKRIISLRVGCREQFLAIHIENYMSAPVQLTDAFLSTTKHDRKYHGFGMLSMRHITEKYHGSMSVHTEGNLFCLDILIPLL